MMKQRGDLAGTWVILSREFEKNILLAFLHHLHLQVTMETPFIIRVAASKVIFNTGCGMEEKKADPRFLIC